MSTISHLLSAAAGAALGYGLSKHSETDRNDTGDGVDASGSDDSTSAGSGGVDYVADCGAVKFGKALREGRVHHPVDGTFNTQSAGMIMSWSEWWTEYRLTRISALQFVRWTDDDGAPNLGCLFLATELLDGTAGVGFIVFAAPADVRDDVAELVATRGTWYDLTAADWEHLVCRGSFSVRLETMPVSGAWISSSDGDVVLSLPVDSQRDSRDVSLIQGTSDLGTMDDTANQLWYGSWIEE